MSSEKQRYEPAVIEPKWQSRWDAHDAFRAERHDGAPKYYVLDMFPYPSGEGLHVGHPEGYTATDILARYHRMKGFDVLHPMGWDAFGLPAEQYALKTGTHPRLTTQKNITTFRRQLKSLGFSYDWSREVDTTDPKYVRWTQWIFLKLFEKGLAYQAEVPVNWCPGLGTVLSNEEVVDGKSERGGFPIVRTPLRQWMLKITAYADRLEADLDTLDWPSTKAKQIDWIGRSVGAEVRFSVADSTETITVFTTRPDTLYGATYLVLAPEHPLVQKIATGTHKDEAAAYAKKVASVSDLDRTSGTKEKSGCFIGAHAVHPITGEKLPIWVADFVLGHYGTGAIMSVPGHDARDFDFAKKMGLPIVEVVSPDGTLHDGTLTEPFPGDGVAVRSPLIDGKNTPAAKEAMIEHLEAKGIGKRHTSYRLRDWVFSRQRYWGEPFPIYFPVTLAPGSSDPRTDPHTIEYGTAIAVAEADLPVVLPDLEDFKPGDDPAGALARAKDWRYFQRDDQWFARETNTMPNWAGSCWYYLRYPDSKNDAEAWSRTAYEAWMPVDLYVGGAEHAVLHLLYARFWHKVLYDLGYVTHAEPFSKLVHQGLILGEDAVKMSKSLGNVVNPDAVVKEFGADSLRVYEMFMGPIDAVKPWQTKGVVGVKRFLDRVWNACAFAEGDEPLDDETERLLHKTIKKVDEDIRGMRFNTAVSAMMILTNRLTELQKVPKHAADRVARLIAPFAPHLAEELYERLGHNTFVSHAGYPTWDEALTVEDVVEIAVQVNGKVRSRVTLAKAATEADARAAIANDEAVLTHTRGKTEKKFLYVPGRIINVVVG